jgi:asparagine synthase (glutamine-hydrolysing)
MCGIAGIIDLNETFQTKELINKFSKFNKFRGPDAFGVSQGKLSSDLTFALAHHRLSIVDLSSNANQPMKKGCWEIVFNGEIFNFRDLKLELKELGSSFQTSSDTEVILELLNVFPIKKALGKLKGMFSLSAINHFTKEVHLARDSWGKKPLYYFHNNDHFSFSSDFRSFNTLGRKFTINESGLKYYFCELALPQPETIFNEIFQLKPGFIGTFKDGTFTQSEYLNLFKKETKSIKPLSEKPSKTIKSLLSSAIENRLQADVPVGAFLSGGIDSSLIVALSNQFSENLNTYTVGFDNNKFDERPYANIIAKKYNTNHHELVINPNDIDIEKLIVEFGEPFADSSMIPSYLISKTVSSHQKVVLSGDGGDELFCGNSTYNQAYKFDELNIKLKKVGFLASLLNIIPIDKVKKMGHLKKNPLFYSGRELNRNLGFQKPELDQLFNNQNVFSIQNIFESKIEEYSSDHSDIFTNIYRGGIRTRLLNDYLVKIDKASMFASLEIRSPFLDDDLFKYVKELDKKALMPNKKLKWILKDLAQDILPKEILNKPKTGFEIPIDEWLIGKWKSIFEHEVLSKKQDLIDLNYDYILKLWQQQLIGGKHGHKLYSILVFHIWAKSFSGN